MKIKILFYLFICTNFLLSCNPKFDSSSEKTFESSKIKIEEKLDDDDKTKLEKALRVITLSAMHQKFNDTTSHISYKQILLNEINGKTYKEVFEIAEKFLKEDRNRNIKRIQKDIAALEKSKAKYQKLKSKLDILEAKPIKIDLINGQIIATCSFTNHSKEYIYNYGTVIIYSSNKDRQDGWNCSSSNSNTSEIAPNGTIMVTCEGDFEYIKQQSNVILWDKIKFPITNFDQYNIVFKCWTEQLTLNGINYELSGNEFDEDAENILQNNKKELKEYQAQEGTLDELELTDK